MQEGCNVQHKQKRGQRATLTDARFLGEHLRRRESPSPGYSKVAIKGGEDRLKEGAADAIGPQRIRERLRINLIKGCILITQE